MRRLRFPGQERPEENLKRGDKVTISLLNEANCIVIIKGDVFFVEEFPKIHKRILHIAYARGREEYELTLELYENAPERDLAYENRVIPGAQLGPRRK